MRSGPGLVQQLAELAQGLDGLARKGGRVDAVGGAQCQEDSLAVAPQGCVGRVTVGEAFLEGSDRCLHGAAVGRRSLHKRHYSKRTSPIPFKPIFDSCRKVSDEDLAIGVFYHHIRPALGGLRPAEPAAGDLDAGDPEDGAGTSLHGCAHQVALAAQLALELLELAAPSSGLLADAGLEFLGQAQTGEVAVEPLVAMLLAVHGNRGRLMDECDGRLDLVDVLAAAAA